MGTKKTLNTKVNKNTVTSILLESLMKAITTKIVTKKKCVTAITREVILEMSACGSEIMKYLKENGIQRI